MARAKPVLIAALVALAAAGGAQANQIRLTSADQARARTAVVRRADLGASGWNGGAKKPDLTSRIGLCRLPPEGLRPASRRALLGARSRTAP